MGTSYDYSILTGLEFEQLITNLLIRLGYKDVSNRRGTADGGINVEAVSVSPITTHSIAIQCKRYADNKVRLHHVRNLDSAVKNEDFTSGVIITSGTFTKDAVDFAAKTSVKISLISGQELTRLINQMFPQNKDLHSIAALPLSQVQPPEVAVTREVQGEHDLEEEPVGVESGLSPELSEIPSERQVASYDLIDLLPEETDGLGKEGNSPLGAFVVVNNRKIKLSSHRQV